ncbi:DUF805 domain-containing protein [Flavobacteriaceae bacterium MHTCC 0001]
MNWYLKVVKDNYANFQGRARRKEFWMFYLFHIIFILVLAFIGGALSVESDSGIAFVAIGIYFLATIIPFLAVSVRRLHDTGKSGWYYLLTLIPYVGGIIMIVLMSQNGDVGKNQYGLDPKNPEIDNEIDEIGKPQIEA